MSSPRHTTRVTSCWGIANPFSSSPERSMLTALLKRLLRKGNTTAAHAGDWVEHAKMLQQAGRHEEAADACAARLKLNADDILALQGLAAALSAQGRVTEGVV